MGSVWGSWAHGWRRSQIGWHHPLLFLVQERPVLEQAGLAWCPGVGWNCSRSWSFYAAVRAIMDPDSQSLITFVVFNACVMAAITVSTQEVAGGPSCHLVGSTEHIRPGSCHLFVAFEQISLFTPFLFSPPFLNMGLLDFNCTATVIFLCLLFMFYLIFLLLTSVKTCPLVSCKT